MKKYLKTDFSTVLFSNESRANGWSTDCVPLIGIVNQHGIKIMVTFKIDDFKINVKNIKLLDIFSRVTGHNREGLSESIFIQNLEL